MHHCHANDCPVPTESKLFMCLRHWKMVPKEMQNKVWSTFRKRGKNVTIEGWLPYYEACADAVEHVAALENKSTENNYRRVANTWRKSANS